MNILVADDHPLYREALVSILDGLGPDIHIIQAETYGEVIERVSEGDVDFDLILLDLYMGSGDWAPIIQRLRLCQPGTPIIVVSGSDSSADAERAIRAGSCGYIPKTMKKEEMLSAIRLLMTGQISIQPRGERAAEPSDTPVFRTDSAGSRVALLTGRQRQVLAEIGAGKSNKLIARALGMTEGTVKLHVAAILKCLGTENRTQAAIVAHQLKFVPRGFESK